MGVGTVIAVVAVILLVILILLYLARKFGFFGAKNSPVARAVTTAVAR